MSAPYYVDEAVTLHHGDCLEVLRALSNSSVDSIVTDPPYGLSNTDPAHVVEALTKWATGDRTFVPTGRGFMGKSWDAFVPPPAVWDECFRVLKPGGHLLAFAGSRTFDLMTLSIRFAGFDIRDGIAWLYGSGFPKSLDVSKAIDKLDASAERRLRALEFTAFIRESGLTAQRIDALTGTNMGGHYTTAASQPAVATADLFDLLRPHLPEVPARIEELVRQRTVESENFAKRPPADYAGGVGMADSWTEGKGWNGKASRGGSAITPEAAMWQGWGTALKPAFEPIVVARKPLIGTVAANVLAHGTGALNIDATRVGAEVRVNPLGTPGANSHRLDGGDGRDATNARAYNVANRGEVREPVTGRWPTNVVMDGDTADALDEQSGTTRSSAHVRHNSALEGAVYAGQTTRARRGTADEGGASRFFPTFRYQAKAPTRERVKVGDVAHPTVKSLELMRWLVRLVTPPGGTVLEPFAGSGTTAEAAVLEGMSCVAVEQDAGYLPLILARIERAKPTPTDTDDQLDLFGGAA